MTEKYQPIPHRLKNMAVGGHVAGAEDIDAGDGKTQQDINADTYRKDETYNTDEIANIISRTPETDVVVLDVPEGSTAADVLDEIPVADRPNKLFRVRNDDNTHYDEYGWTGEAWALLASKDYGIDDEIVEGTKNNIPTTAAVAALISNYWSTAVDTLGIQFAITDKDGNVLAYTDSEKFNFLVNIVAKSLNVESLEGTFSVENLESENNAFANTIVAWTDENYNIILAVTTDYKFISGIINFNTLYSVVKAYGNRDMSAFYRRNAAIEPILLNDCSKGTSAEKLQLAITTDTHNNPETFQKTLDAAKDFTSVDAILFLGDQCDNTNSIYGAEGDAYISKYQDLIASASKPLFMMPGNHDVGNYCKTVLQTRDDKLMYERFVKPAVDNGFLLEGEYEENRNYYFHDFDNRKVRLIVLYPFEDGNVFDTTYWEPVTYDDTKPILSKGHYNENDIVNIQAYTEYSFKCCNENGVDVIATYSSQGYTLNPDCWERIPYDNSYPDVVKKESYIVGDVVNVPEYVANSFRCVNDTTVSSSTIYDFIGSEYVPTYKALRIPMWYSQAQLEWLCDTLEDAGEKGYLCVIAQHYSYMDAYSYHEESRTTRFDEGGVVGNYNYRFPEDTNYPNTEKRVEVICDIVNAYQNGASIVIDNLQAISTAAGTRKSSDYYRGNDDCSSIPAINLDHTFINSGPVIFLHGHNHKDTIIRHNVYNQMQIGFLCNKKTNALTSGNIIRSAYDDNIAGEHVDFVTVYSTNGVMENNLGQEVPENHIHITRAGNFYSRKIDSNTNTLIKKDNEIVKF